ncbi:MAG: hypothetical protein A3F43_00660 [Gammaproteobacteria bacterium RIFCSPHIGHO2_12_FULL_42_10]|nr:MAG: hypothetical protein A3F43_00660 [Gammaproteobacteria bacterium RIFCSPHIGHO2_12_FULL_42_10]
MIEQETVCLRKLGKTRAGEVKLGRWLANEKVTKEELGHYICERSRSLVSNRHVLAIQDTTQLNYVSKENRIKGLGPLGNGTTCKGFLLHAMLIVDAQANTCLGLAGLKSWVRDPREKEKRKSRVYRNRCLEEKETFRWVEMADTAKELLSECEEVTFVADRESDIYEKWARIPDSKTHMLVRSNQDRRLTNGMKLTAYVDQLEAHYSYEVDVSPKPGKRIARKAKVTLRFGQVEIKKPVEGIDRKALSSLRLHVVDVRELNETSGEEEPIHWCLLTTHEIKTTEQALQIVSWYCQRWHIEQFFRTLQKQGLKVESSQVETVEALMKLVTVACCAALQIMQLTLARHGKDQLASVVFNENEKKLLSKLQKTLEGKTEKQKNPYPEGMLSWAAWIIARLGGWKGYKSESPPGPITMYDGLKRYQSIYEGWTLLDVCIE